MSGAVRLTMDMMTTMDERNKMGITLFNESGLAMIVMLQTERDHRCGLPPAAVHRGHEIKRHGPVGMRRLRDRGAKGQRDKADKPDGTVRGGLGWGPLETKVNLDVE